MHYYYWQRGVFFFPSLIEMYLKFMGSQIMKKKSYLLRAVEMQLKFIGEAVFWLNISIGRITLSLHTCTLHTYITIMVKRLRNNNARMEAEVLR